MSILIAPRRISRFLGFPFVTFFTASTLILCGCRPTAVEPGLSVQSVSVWNMLPDGRRVPGPRALTVGLSDEAVVLDDAGRVLVYQADGKVARSWAMPASDQGNPEGVCVLSNGHIVVADTHYSRVVTFRADGSIAHTFGERGTAPGQMTNPVGICTDGDNRLFVCEYGARDRVQAFALDGKFLYAFGQSGGEPGQFQRPSDLVWNDGLLYVADAVNNRVQVFTDRGEFVKVLGHDLAEPPTFYLPYDLAIGQDSHLYVVEYGGARVCKLDLSGRLLGHFGTAGAGLEQLETPWGIGINSELDILVADTGNRRLLVVEHD